MGKRLDRFNIALRAFWEKDYKNVQRLLEKLDDETLGKMYGMTVEVTPTTFFPAPPPSPEHKLMVGLIRSWPGKGPYLILLGSKPTPRIVYHEVAHAIGIDDEEEAEEFAKRFESV